MPNIREIPGYSDHATNNGCYFLNRGQLMISDPVTGVKRRERVWTTDVYIEENEFDTILEFSESFATQVADALGWVSVEKVAALKAEIFALKARATLAEADAADAIDAVAKITRLAEKAPAPAKKAAAKKAPVKKATDV